MSTSQKRQRIRVCLKAYDHKLIDEEINKFQGNEEIKKALTENLKQIESGERDFRF